MLKGGIFVSLKIKIAFKIVIKGWVLIRLLNLE